MTVPVSQWRPDCQCPWTLGWAVRLPVFGASISVMSGSELCLPDVDMQAVPIQDADRDRMTWNKLLPRDNLTRRVHWQARAATAATVKLSPATSLVYTLNPSRSLFNTANIPQHLSHHNHSIHG